MIFNLTQRSKASECRQYFVSFVDQCPFGLGPAATTNSAKRKQCKQVSCQPHSRHACVSAARTSGNALYVSIHPGLAGGRLPCNQGQQQMFMQTPTQHPALQVLQTHPHPTLHRLSMEVFNQPQVSAARLLRLLRHDQHHPAGRAPQQGRRLIG